MTFWRSLSDPRHPIRRRAVWLAVIGIVTQAGITLGVDVDAVVQLGLSLVNLLVLGGVLTVSSEKRVTPSADPRDSAGRPLVPLSDGVSGTIAGVAHPAAVDDVDGPAGGSTPDTDDTGSTRF